jgi:hypothetical protein
MTDMVRKAILVVVSLFMIVGVASAVVPDPSKSTAPARVFVGGKETLQPDQAHRGVEVPPGTPSQFNIAYTVTVRDFSNNPIAAALVELNFQNCTDTRLCSFVFNGQSVDCIGRAVRGTTNAAGQLTFKVLGAGVNDSPPAPPAIAPGAGAGCIRIFAEGVQIGVATAVVYDQDGAVPPIGVGNQYRNGVKGSDLPIILTEIGAANSGAPYRGRSDYKFDPPPAMPAVNGADLSAFLTILGESNSGKGSGNGCSDNSALAVPYCP